MFFFFFWMKYNFDISLWDYFSDKSWLIFMVPLSACVLAHMLVFFLSLRAALPLGLIWQGHTGDPCQIIKTLWLSCASRVYCNVWHTAEYATWETSNDTLHPESSFHQHHQGGTWRALKLPSNLSQKHREGWNFHWGDLLKKSVWVITVMHLFLSALQWWMSFFRLPLLVKHHTFVLNTMAVRNSILLFPFQYICCHFISI